MTAGDMNRVIWHNSFEGEHEALFGKDVEFSVGRIIGHTITATLGALLFVGGISGAKAGLVAGTLTSPAGGVAIAVGSVAAGAVLATAGIELVQSAFNGAANDPNIKFSTGNGSTGEEPSSGHMMGENGTQIRGSKTTGQNGKTERVDVENPSPGNRPGDIHYHDSGNTKWRYDIDSGKLVDPETGELAPPKVQKVLEEKWFQKAIEKASNILGE